ncbi:hypothetical protein [Rhodoluna limnophila]|uniref:hypothetical protein n=1 Tax=Rhodoluna limnophila TaxID=232537 RepID=UPI0011063A7F|nr:hypothetical protein [Rhodoluna limnophila]
MAPMFIGLLMFSTATLLVIVTATSLIIFQKRLTGLAEGAALWSAQQGLPADNYFGQLPEDAGLDLVLSDIEVSDGKTVTVQVCGRWQAPISISITPSNLMVCSQASARAG